MLMIKGMILLDSSSIDELEILELNPVEKNENDDLKLVKISQNFITKILCTMKYKVLIIRDVFLFPQSDLNITIIEIFAQREMTMTLITSIA